MKGNVLFGLFMTAVLFQYPATAWEPGVPGADWEKSPEFTRPWDGNNPDYRSLQAALFFLTNDLRVGAGLPPLAYQPALERAAWSWAAALRDKAELGFDSPASPRLENSGVVSGSISENLGAVSLPSGFTPLGIAREFMNIWMASHAHKALVYSRQAVELGCGISVKTSGEFGEFKAVQTYSLGSPVGTKTPTVYLPWEKPTATVVTRPVTAPVNPEPPRRADPVVTPPRTSGKDFPSLSWGASIDTLKDPRYFGVWKGRQDAYRVDLPLDFLVGQEKPQWVLAITRPGKKELASIFVKIPGKKASLFLERFKADFGLPVSSARGVVEGDTEPALIHLWKNPAGQLKVFEGETNTYLQLLEP